MSIVPKNVEERGLGGIEKYDDVFGCILIRAHYKYSLQNIDIE